MKGEKLLEEIREAIQKAKREKAEKDITIKVRPGLLTRWSETVYHTEHEEEE